MSQDSLLVEIESVDDYLDNSFSLFDGSLRKTRGPVAIIDISSVTSYDDFRYGMPGITFGSRTQLLGTMSYSKFVKIKGRSYTRGRYYYFETSSETLRFDNEDDALEYIAFVQQYNALIERMLIEGIDKCFAFCTPVYENSIEFMQNFLDMIPSALFTNVDLYKAMMRRASLGTGEFLKRFLDFTDEENSQIATILSDTNNKQTFQNTYNTIVHLANLLLEQIGIRTEYCVMTAALLIRRALIERYGEIWESKYDSYPNVHSESEYIKSCILEGTLTANDPIGIAALTYYLMSLDLEDHIEFHDKYEAVISVIKEAEIVKSQNNFRQMFFQKRNEPTIPDKATIDDIDLMSGDEFEILVCRLFMKMGYDSKVTKHSGDQGVDVIAQKGGIKIGIQTKCYGGKVGNSAIQEVVAGSNYYGCTKSMVVTNNYFTQSAISLANANNVILWDREILKDKLLKM